MSSEVRGRCETPSYFFVYLRVPSFQPAYAASLCSLVGKGLYEPITTLASGCSCKPDSHSPTSSNYFVVTFAPLARSLCSAPAVVRKRYRYFIFYLLLAMSPEVGDNREILAYFLFMLQALSFQPVAVWQTCLLSAVVCCRKSSSLRKCNL